jgi:plastocyanin
MKKPFLSGGFGLFTVGLVCATLSVQAANFTVTVNGSHFSPTALTIEVGDTVDWEDQDIFGDPHTTTSNLTFTNPNYWNGLLVDPGDVFSHTFNNVGTFAYHDQADTGTGTITVVLPAPPGIILTSPRKEGTQFIFDVTGLTVGKTNVLQTSTNLLSWTAIKTNVASSSTLTFTNTMTLPRRFFRVFERP